MRPVGDGIHSLLYVPADHPRLAELRQRAVWEARYYDLRAAGKLAAVELCIVDRIDAPTGEVDPARVGELLQIEALEGEQATLDRCLVGGLPSASRQKKAGYMLTF